MEEQLMDILLIIQ